MIVGELRQKFPEVDVYEFKDDCNYLIVMEPGHRNEVLQGLTSVGKQVLVLQICDPANAVKLLEGEGAHDINLKLLGDFPWRSHPEQHANGLVETKR